jgi:prepilin-type N-terminal cleavage/methylation domain-containing protein
MRVRASGGFTLVELLVVIVIFSLILVMLAGGQDYATRGWRTQERQIDAQADVGAVQNALRQLIVSGRAFQGDDQSLKWVGALPRALDRAGLYDITMAVDDHRLFVTWRPHFSGPMPKSDPQTANLATDVENLRLSYYVQQDPEPGRWADEIKDKKPALIKIAAQLSRGRWPPLVVAPMIEPPPAPAPALPDGAAGAATLQAGAPQAGAPQPAPAQDDN